MQILFTGKAHGLSVAIPVNSPYKMPVLSEQFAHKKSSQIPFFKDKSSPFPSGYASLERLSSNLIQSELGETFFLEKDYKKISPALVPYVTAFHLSRVWIEKYTKKRVKPNHHLDLTTLLLNYETDPYDRGLLLTLKKSALKEKADLKSKTLKNISEFNYFIPISFDKGFVKVLFQNQFGYIDMNDCISKFDFAQFAYSYKSKNNSWNIVKKREFDFFLIQKNEAHEKTEIASMHLNEVKGLVVDQRLAISFKPNDSYPTWTSFQIKKEKAKPWQQSQLTGHGKVWWQKPELSLMNNQPITIDQLIKKDIYSVSFQASQPKKGLASAQGVYITEDGQNWTLIPQFNDYSGPVYYHNDLILFVGNYKSIDGGKTFDHYIQVDKVSKAVSEHFGIQPKKIKITKIKMQKPYNVLIDVSTGSKKVRLKSPLFAQDWKPLR